MNVYTYLSLRATRLGTGVDENSPAVIVWDGKYILISTYRELSKSDCDQITQGQYDRDSKITFFREITAVICYRRVILHSTPSTGTCSIETRGILDPDLSTGSVF